LPPNIILSVGQSVVYSLWIPQPVQVIFTIVVKLQSALILLMITDDNDG